MMILFSSSASKENKTSDSLASASYFVDVMFKFSDAQACLRAKKNFRAAVTAGLKISS